MPYLPFEQLNEPDECHYCGRVAYGVNLAGKADCGTCDVTGHVEKHERAPWVTQLVRAARMAVVHFEGLEGFGDAANPAAVLSQLRAALGPAAPAPQPRADAPVPDLDICPTCQLPVESGAFAVYDFGNDARYHKDCQNPLTALNAALDAREAERARAEAALLAGRKAIKREIELRGWGYEDIPLPRLREMVDALIAEYGPEATWHVCVEWECLTFKINYTELETAEEAQQRLYRESRLTDQRAIAQAGWDKLTAEERFALGARMPCN